MPRSTLVTRVCAIRRTTQTRTGIFANDSVANDEVAEFTGRAGLVYDFAPWISAYALYAQSIQPDIFSVGRDGQPLDPQEGDIWEVGVKTEWLENRFTATAALFRIDRDKIPINDPTNGPGEFFAVSSGLQRSDGMELEVNGEPLAGWMLSFGGSRLDSEFKERDDPFFGTKPGGTADWQIGFFTSYELQEGFFRGLGGGVGLFAIDERGVSTFFEGAVLPGYQRVDLSLFYDGLEPFRLSLQVRNVFDATYVEGVDRPSSLRTIRLARCAHELADRARGALQPGLTTAVLSRKNVSG
jgi:iron complex outermembrane recepter protein